MDDGNVFDIFNNKLIEFAKDLVYIYPDVNDFNIFLTACTWIVQLDKYAPQSLFNYHVIKPYGEMILKKDESFFLVEKYESANAYFEHYGNDFNIIEKLKKIWIDLDITNKDTIWKYMQVLTLISNKCKGKNLEQLHNSIFVTK